jgi:thioredoxin reductase (NADPH)
MLTGSGGAMGASEHTTALVIGAGPAGLSAALWLDRLGVPAVVLERGSQLGGELARVNLPIEDLLGCPAQNGEELRRLIAAQVGRRGLRVRLGCAVHHLDPATRQVTTSDGVFTAAGLILALGLTRRLLAVPGAEKLLGRGITLSGTTDRQALAGEHPLVLGGGDGAFENALLLAAVCPHVTLLHRGREPVARPAFRRQVAAHPRITVLPEAEVQEVAGASWLERVRVADPHGSRWLATRWLVVKIGFRPNTGLWGPEALAVDDRGFVQVDRELATSCPGVFAAGDVANPRAPCLAAALGDGAIAARSLFNYLFQEKNR